MAGICLRGKPGWGDLGASFTTVLNTFGGTWWSANRMAPSTRRWSTSRSSRRRFSSTSMVKDAGEKDAASASFNECLTQYKDGKVAMWYDATVAAGLLEAERQRREGEERLRRRAGQGDARLGLAVVVGAGDPGDLDQGRPRLEYISFATGPSTSSRPGTVPGGWAAIPPGTRESTYEIPEYKKAAAAFAEPTLDSIARRRSTTPARPSARGPGCPVRRHPGVPGRRQPVHRAVLRGDRRAGVDRLGAQNCQNIASQVGG